MSHTITLVKGMLLLVGDTKRSAEWAVLESYRSYTDKYGDTDAQITVRYERKVFGITRRKVICKDDIYGYRKPESNEVAELERLAKL